jgi:hypothetical protein
MVFGHKKKIFGRKAKSAYRKKIQRFVGRRGGKAEGFQTK